jgi:hypothetical protein
MTATGYYAAARHPNKRPLPEAGAAGTGAGAPYGGARGKPASASTTRYAPEALHAMSMGGEKAPVIISTTP